MGDNVDAQTISLAWLDNSPDDAADHVFAQEQLRLLDKNLQIFKNIKECEDYIKSQSVDARITLIVNGRLGQQIVPGIHQLSQIIAIYVYCLNKELHEKWASNYNKVRGVFVDFNLLQKQLQPNHSSGNHSIVVEVPTTITSQAETTSIENLYDLDIPYMISDSCFDYLCRMNMLPTDKEDFFSLCQNVLQGNDQLLAILQEFKEGYSPDRAISWLYRDAFFIGYINCIFTVAHIDSIYVCRAFIHDIYKQLEQHKCTSTIQVYRCEQMSNENFQKLKQLNGKIIPMKSWFLTNSNREAILSYMSSYDSSNECKRILFIIEADPQIPNVKPFAKIGSLSNYNDPNDVLFMIGSLFKITEIEDEKDGIINIKMTLCANDDENALKASFDRLKYQYINSNGETDLIGFGQLLFAIGNSLRDKDISNRGEELIRSFLGKLPKDHADHVRCYDALGYIDFFKNEFDSSLDWYKKSFEIKKDKLPANDPNLAESYKNMAAAYLQKKDFTQALEYFKQLLIILKQLYGDDHIALIPCYADMASIYETEDKLTEAFSCYSQVEVILIKNHATNDMDFARLCNNLGKIRTFLGHYHLALGYYMTSLQIKSSLLTSVDPSIATTYKNIGLVYGYMDNLEQSRENLEKAAEIYRQVQSHDNPNVTEIEELIQNLTSPPK